MLGTKKSGRFSEAGDEATDEMCHIVTFKGDLHNEPCTLGCPNSAGSGLSHGR